MAVLLTGEALPFAPHVRAGLSAEALARRVACEGLRMPLAPLRAPRAAALVERMWAAAPRERPPAREAAAELAAALAEAERPAWLSLADAAAAALRSAPLRAARRLWEEGSGPGGLAVAYAAAPRGGKLGTPATGWLAGGGAVPPYVPVARGRAGSAPSGAVEMRAVGAGVAAPGGAAAAAGACDAV